MNIKKNLKSKIYLFNSHALIFGVPVNAAPHIHHALQFSIGLEESFQLHNGQNQENMRAALIGANVRHHFDNSSGFLVNLYLDAESRPAREIAETMKIRQHLKIELSDIEPFLPELRNGWENTFSCREAFELIENMLHNLFQTTKTAINFDPRIERALEILKTAPDNLISAEEVAEAINLSSSRFAHLFRAEVGLPVRRYLLWRRLRNAVQMLADGESLTTVAHAAGFADSAHLTRTFRQMFGIAPSEIFQNSKFVQVSFCDE